MSVSLVFQYGEQGWTNANEAEYQILSCLQWRTESLHSLEIATRQKFAILSKGDLEQNVIDLAERAHSVGALSPVNLIAVEEDQIYLFLGSDVASTTIATVESLWNKDEPWAIRLMSADELANVDSDLDFWPDAQEILQSHELGLSEFKTTEEELLAYSPPMEPSLSADDGREFSKPDVLRDLCIHALLSHGIRKGEILSMTVREYHSLVRGDFPTIKSGSGNKPVPVEISTQTANLLSEHIANMNSTENQYLFPSRRDSSRHIAFHNLFQVYASWREEQINKVLENFYVMQKLGRAPQQDIDVSRLIRERMGHHALDALQCYVETSAGYVKPGQQQGPDGSSSAGSGDQH
ncbi:site-specific integrase [Pseudomonas sp. LM20]|uniref:site-specific integrase n=1 Tax=Pseudomonas sp. LM20 TaxID=2899116 RepID=UPI001F2D19C3|nr:site-specific integrase [Pseudomonas sp. LM20]MCE5988833.1 site-specific integrase [Pseudomonas sp. LM20]